MNLGEKVRLESISSHLIIQMKNYGKTNISSYTQYHVFCSRLCNRTQQLLTN